MTNTPNLENFRYERKFVTSELNLPEIEHLIKDIKHLNNNEFAGIYAAPYKWQGDEIVMRSKDRTKCKIFVEQTFTKVANS